MRVEVVGSNREETARRQKDQLTPLQLEVDPDGVQIKLKTPPCWTWEGGLEELK